MIIYRVQTPISSRSAITGTCALWHWQVQFNAGWYGLYQSGLHLMALDGYHRQRGCYFIRLYDAFSYVIGRIEGVKVCDTYPVALFQLKIPDTSDLLYAYAARCGYAKHIKPREYFLPTSYWRPWAWVPSRSRAVLKGV